MRTGIFLDYSDGNFSFGEAVEHVVALERAGVDICRQVWRREKVSYDGKHYQLPLPPASGTPPLVRWT